VFDTTGGVTRAPMLGRVRGGLAAAQQANQERPLPVAPVAAPSTKRPEYQPVL
jgi:hypothetical protein